MIKVTPCVGVWIEIDNIRRKVATHQCHSLRGSVD